MYIIWLLALKERHLVDIQRLTASHCSNHTFIWITMLLIIIVTKYKPVHSLSITILAVNCRTHCSNVTLVMKMGKQNSLWANSLVQLWHVALILCNYISWVIAASSHFSFPLPVPHPLKRLQFLIVLHHWKTAKCRGNLSWSLSYAVNVLLNIKPKMKGPTVNKSLAFFLGQSPTNTSPPFRVSPEALQCNHIGMKPQSSLPRVSWKRVGKQTSYLCILLSCRSAS